MEGRSQGEGSTLESTRMTTMKMTRDVAKEDIIISLRPQGWTGWSSYGCAAKNEEEGAEAKAGQTGWGGGSAVQTSVTGPCGMTKSTTTMDLAAMRIMRISRSRRRKGLIRKIRRTTSPPKIYALAFMDDWNRPSLSASSPGGKLMWGGADTVFQGKFHQSTSMLWGR